jgi:2-polyprenyl-3-methyl-5-hydroxy-6-metoxy-1,4-benzoquinol methylase
MMNLWQRIQQRRKRQSIYTTAEFWNEKARRSQGKAASMWPNQHLNELYHAAQINILDEWLTSSENQRILDLGCGTGRISRYLAARGAKVSGLDFSDEAIAVARRESFGHDIDFKQGSVFDLSEDSEFDAIVCLGVIAVACRSSAEAQDVVQRIVKAAKPGGRIIVIEPFHDNWLSRCLKLHCREFRAMVNEAGAEIVDAKELAFWPVRLVLCEINWPKFVVRTLFVIGEAVLNTVGRGMGDYKAMVCVRR